MGWLTATRRHRSAGAPHGIPTNSPARPTSLKSLRADGPLNSKPPTESFRRNRRKSVWLVGTAIPLSGAYSRNSHRLRLQTSRWLDDMTEPPAVTGTVDTELGYAVAIRGNTIVVDGFNATSTIGAAYVFEKPAGGWTDMTQPATLTSSVASDSFGFSLAMDEHTILVGAPEGGRTLRRLMQC